MTLSITFNHIERLLTRLVTKPRKLTIKEEYTHDNWKSIDDTFNQLFGFKKVYQSVVIINNENGELLKVLLADNKWLTLTRSTDEIQSILLDYIIYRIFVQSKNMNVLLEPNKSQYFDTHFTEKKGSFLNKKIHRLLVSVLRHASEEGYLPLESLNPSAFEEEEVDAQFTFLEHRNDSFLKEEVAYLFKGEEEEEFTLNGKFMKNFVSTLVNEHNNLLSSQEVDMANILRQNADRIKEMDEWWSHLENEERGYTKRIVSDKPESVQSETADNDEYNALLEYVGQEH